MDQKTVGTGIALVVLLTVLAAWAFNRQDQPPAQDPSAPEESVHLLMGNPSGATADEAQRDNYLLKKPYYALSYNDSKATPNWVSWCVQKSDLGPAPRTEFYPDPDLPQIFHHVRPMDYTGSGFDRGHTCPRSDRTSTPEASRATFAMTNVFPQAPAVNQKAWADLEDYCRGLVIKKHQTLYVVSGPQGQGGTGTKGHAETVAGGRITVPAHCWKVILAVDDGTGTADDLGRVGASTRTIAVIMPNEESVGHGWAKFRKSIKDVETLTGYQFFNRIPANVIDPLKAKVDDEHVPAPHQHKTGG